MAAVEYVNYEAVPGAIVEFGVFTGKSLALLARAHSFDPKGMERKIVGFDSFDGLPRATELHARWRPGACRTVHDWHPFLAPGSVVTPDAPRELFRLCGLPEPEIEAGPFHEVLPRVVPGKYGAVALVHVDCDLYESARDALFGIAPALEDGAILLFDDWFHYRGNPRRGEARAFREFLEAHPEWEAVHYRSYAVFSNAFILHRR